MEERAMIQTQLKMGMNLAAVAAGLKISPSSRNDKTVFQELSQEVYVKGGKRC